MKTDRRYLPSKCFDSFAFSQALPRCSLDELGTQYYEHRRQLMLQMQLGLTKTYNLFHDPNLSPEVVAKASKQDADVAAEAYFGLLRLRELHREMDREMDQGVLAAYGWHEPTDDGPPIDLRHDFYEVDYLPENDRVRFTIHPDARRELLKRLLLNHRRHAEEVEAGKHEKESDTKKKATTKKKAKAKPAGPSLFADELAE